MRQYAPYPHALKELVDKCQYRRWVVDLVDIERDPADTHGHSAGGLTLRITTLGYNAYRVGGGENYRVNHYFIVPAATYNRASWVRWLFERFLEVERHEAMEFFRIAGSDWPNERPFAPTHGPGDDPYIVHEFATERQAAMDFRGEVRQDAAG